MADVSISISAADCGKGVRRPFLKNDLLLLVATHVITLPSSWSSTRNYRLVFNPLEGTMTEDIYDDGGNVGRNAGTYSVSTNKSGNGELVLHYSSVTPSPNPQSLFSPRNPHFHALSHLVIGPITPINMGDAPTGTFSALAEYPQDFGVKESAVFTFHSKRSRK